MATTLTLNEREAAMDALIDQYEHQVTGRDEVVARINADRLMFWFVASRNALRVAAIHMASWKANGSNAETREYYEERAQSYRTTAEMYRERSKFLPCPEIGGYDVLEVQMMSANGARGDFD